MRAIRAAVCLLSIFVLKAMREPLLLRIILFFVHPAVTGGAILLAFVLSAQPPGAAEDTKEAEVLTLRAAAAAGVIIDEEMLLAASAAAGAVSSEAVGAEEMPKVVGRRLARSLSAGAVLQVSDLAQERAVAAGLEQSKVIRAVFKERKPRMWRAGRSAGAYPRAMKF